jgi:hypothetical protein
VLADRLDTTTRNLSTAGAASADEPEPSTQPPVDSEDRPTPVPDDPFAQPSHRPRRLPLGIAGPVIDPTFDESLDDSASLDESLEIEQRRPDAPSFDDAPEMAHRIDDSPSWDSWDSWNQPDVDPKTQKRLDRVMRQLHQDGAFDAKRTLRAPQSQPVDGSEEAPASPARRRHPTLQSAGSLPPERLTAAAETGDPPRAPRGDRKVHRTVPDGQLRAVRDAAVDNATTAPMPVAERPEEPEQEDASFRPTKVTMPLQPDESLKRELESLREEFKERLEKARRERNRKDSD